MVSPTRCVHEALRTVQSKSLVELYRPDKVLAITDFRNSMRWAYTIYSLLVDDTASSGANLKQSTHFEAQ